MIVAPRDFKWEELIIPKQIFEQEGAIVVVSSTKNQAIDSSKMHTIDIDKLVEEININEYDALVIVGGPGSPELANYPVIISLIREALRKNKTIGAICLGPTVLARAGILNGFKATVFPDRNAINILRENGANYVNQPLVKDRNIITANGPTQAQNFAKEIVENLS